jgi:mono/diheme cytochrome c family protein
MASSIPVTLFVVIAALLLGCSEADSRATSAGQAKELGRWYTSTQVSTGETVFQSHCAVCHGDKAQGLAAEWREKLDDGSFPPPPLNGTAHAWHHPLSLLTQVVNAGGIPLGGKMPAFAEVLTDDENLSAIAYFQNFWDDEIYGSWQQMGGTN